MSQILCIKNLDFFIDEDGLRLILRKFGKLLSVHLVRDQITRTSRGTAFVEFEDDTDAEVCIQEMDGKVIEHRMISVRRSKAYLHSSARLMMWKMKTTE